MTTVGNQWVFLKLIQFPNRSKLEMQLKFHLSLNWCSNFCKAVRRYFVPMCRKLQKKWKILVSTAMQMANWGWPGLSSLLMFSWEENGAVLFWPQTLLHATSLVPGDCFSVLFIFLEKKKKNKPWNTKERWLKDSMWVKYREKEWFIVWTML